MILTLGVVRYRREMDDCEFPRKVVDEVLNEHGKLLVEFMKDLG